tara:strand:- start:122 stop:682 length:561 start_codon:yes stop_codon:yes gene_type:complete
MTDHSELVTGAQDLLSLKTRPTHHDFTPFRRPSRSRSRSRSRSPSFKAAPSAYDDENYSIDSIYKKRMPVTYRKGPPDSKESSEMMNRMMENIIKNDYQRTRAERASNSVERYGKPKPTLLQTGKPLGFSGKIITKPPGTTFGKILRRAVKRSSKSAVLKQLAAFNRKNKKHTKKCFLYAQYIIHN